MAYGRIGVSNSVTFRRLACAYLRRVKSISRPHMTMARFLPLSLFVCSGFVCSGLLAQAPDTAFFEAKIRPVLTTKCYGCHSSKLKAPMGGLALDTQGRAVEGRGVRPGFDAGKT